MSGWIKTWRSLASWEWYSSPNCVQIFVDLLIHANYENGSYRGVFIPKGSLTTSREKIAKRTGLSVQAVRTVLRKLISSKEITIKSTKKFTMISIVNWDKFQSGDNQQINPQSNQNINQQSTRKLTTSKKEEIKKGEINNNPDLFETEPNQLGEDTAINEMTIKVLTSFNSILGKRCKPTKFNLDIINRRIKDGYTLEEFAMVFKHKLETWGNDPRMSHHLVPGTIFSGKFDGYLEVAKNANKPQIDPLDSFFEPYIEKLQESLS